MNISFMVTIAMLGIPFYGYGWSSALIGIIILGILGVYLFADLNKKYQISARTLNTSLLCIMMIMVGYSSYALIVIRSTANTPMDQNSPEDIFTLGEYLGREQYGTRPLFYGQTYASKPALKEVDGGCVYDVTEGAPVYQRKEKATPDEKDSYEIVRHKTDYNMHKICSSHACTARTRTGLRRLAGRHQRRAGSLRPVRTDGDGESPDPMG